MHGGHHGRVQFRLRKRFASHTSRAGSLPSPIFRAARCVRRVWCVPVDIKGSASLHLAVSVRGPKHHVMAEVIVMIISAMTAWFSH